MLADPRSGEDRRPRRDRRRRYALGGPGAPSPGRPGGRRPEDDGQRCLGHRLDVRISTPPTAVAVDALERLRDTAGSHHRAIVLEVMGRHAGWVALATGLAGGADATLLPEEPYDEADAGGQGALGRRAPGATRSSSLAKGSTSAPRRGSAGAKDEFGHELLREREVGARTRAADRGRPRASRPVAPRSATSNEGARPTLFDRILATRLGAKAVDLALAGRFGEVAVLRGGAIEGSRSRMRLAVAEDSSPPDWIDLLRTFEPLGSRWPVRALWFRRGPLHLIDQRQASRPRPVLRQSRGPRRSRRRSGRWTVRGAPAIGGRRGLRDGPRRPGGSVNPRARGRASAERRARRRTTCSSGSRRSARAWDAGEEPLEAAALRLPGADRRRVPGRSGIAGAPLLPSSGPVLTHCNAGASPRSSGGRRSPRSGWPATAGPDLFVWVDETRPLLQGSRLTAWELAREGSRTPSSPTTPRGITSQHGEVDAVIVGADRIAANGDFANKIGTYEKARPRPGERRPVLRRGPVEHVRCPPGERSVHPGRGTGPGRGPGARGQADRPDAQPGEEPGVRCDAGEVRHRVHHTGRDRPARRSRGRREANSRQLTRQAYGAPRGGGKTAPTVGTSPTARGRGARRGDGSFPEGRSLGSNPRSHRGHGARAPGRGRRGSRRTSYFLRSCSAPQSRTADRSTRYKNVDLHSQWGFVLFRGGPIPNARTPAGAPRARREGSSETVAGPRRLGNIHSTGRLGLRGCPGSLAV